MRQSYRFWTAADKALLRILYPHMKRRDIAELMGRSFVSIRQKAQSMRLRKSRDFLRGDLGGRIKPGSDLGKNTQYQPGNVPWNKGVKTGPAKGGSRFTTFKPGHPGAHRLPLGSERLNSSGYWVRKVRDTPIRKRNWALIHRLVWETAHGPVPRGAIVIFRDGDHNNMELDNLECITRKELIERHSIHHLPDDVRELCHLMGTLTRAINRAENARQH